MKTLVIDTSSNILYISFYQEKEEIYLFDGIGKNNHSENLIKLLKIGLDNCNLQMHDFGRIIVGIGPGSYTGLRVALTVAKTFAWTLSIPLYTASSLDMLASGYLGEDGIYAISLKAKKDFVYGKIIEVKQGVQKIIFDDSFLEKDVFYKKIRGINCLEIGPENYRFNPLNLNIKRVEDLHNLTPNYLRREI